MLFRSAWDGQLADDGLDFFTTVGLTVEVDGGKEDAGAENSGLSPNGKSEARSLREQEIAHLSESHASSLLVLRLVTTLSGVHEMLTCLCDRGVVWKRRADPPEVFACGVEKRGIAQL